MGGGNSAGQAVVYLAGHARKVWLLVRGAGLEASMSRYLIDRIAGLPNVELRHPRRGDRAGRRRRQPADR